MSIAAAVRAIPGKKENLRKALEEIQSHSSSLASFTLQWKGLEDHFSSIEKSIEERLKELESKEKSIEERLKELESKEKSRSGSYARASPPEKSAPAVKADEELVATPRPELKSLCVKLDGKGLVAFINENRTDLAEIKKEINPAIRLASDPAKLVLDAVEGFYPSNIKGGFYDSNRWTYILLLERLRVISPEIKVAIKEKAKKLAVEWKGKISEAGENDLEALFFLQLLASYGLTAEFKLDEVLDLIVLVSRRNQIIDLCRALGLADKVPDLILKLNSKGKQLDAVKFVYAFDLVDKFPPVPLLKVYIKESNKAAQELRKKGNNSIRVQNEATDKELSALRGVIKAIVEYKLESDCSWENLEKRVSQLEQQTAERKKRKVQSTVAPNSRSQQHQQQANKRPRPSTANEAVRPSTAMANAAAAVTMHSTTLLQSQPHLGLVDRAPYLSSATPYDLVGTGSLYEHAGSSLVGNPLGMGANRSPTKSYIYSAESLMGSALYNRPVSYATYPLPGSLPSQYNPSLYR